MSTSPNSWQLSVDPGASSVSLTFLGDTTPNITDLSATGIQTALENLANVGEGNGSVLMNADGSFCVTITADLGNADPALALVGTAIGAIINIEPISQAEASLRAQLLQMDAANAPGLAAAAAAVTASLNAYTGTNASWNLVIGSGVNQFTLTFLSQTTPEIPVPGLTAAQIQTALQALSSLGSSNCVVNANPDGSYTISLSGALADTAEPANALTGIPDAGTMTITQTNPGNAPAGSDQNAAIQSAQADFNSALSAATTAMGTIGTSLTTASTEAGAIAGPVDQGSAIAVITTASNGIATPAAASNPGSGDVTASDLNPRLATLVTQIQTVFGDIVTALNGLNAQNTGAVTAALTHAKNGLNALQSVGAQFNTLVQPGDQDVEATKVADLAIIQGLVS